MKTDSRIATKPALAVDAGSASFMRGYAKGYKAGLSRGRKESGVLTPQFIPRLPRIEDETGNGYTCVTCGIQRPTTWYIYAIERAGKWVTPCCAKCARETETKTRGPFPQNNEFRDGAHDSKPNH